MKLAQYPKLYKKRVKLWIYAELDTDWSIWNLTLVPFLLVTKCDQKSANIPQIIIDRKSKLCGLIRSIALVLALLNGNKDKLYL